MRAAIYARVSTLEQEPENSFRSCAATVSCGVGRWSNTLTVV